MPLNTTRARELLAKGDLRPLFIEELGWDRHAATLKVTVEGSTLDLYALAQKRGMVAYHCPTPEGQRLPDYAHRRKIEQQIAKAAHEHLIVFTDAGNQTQVWQWVKRELGRPTACREHTFHHSQPGDALLQKLEPIAFTLAEEERLSLTDVTRRTRAGFDVDRVTKRFYERFQDEHAIFLEFIAGISNRADQEWYASLMLNRLMFVYFMQRKGFLDGDRDYLRNRLHRMQAQHGTDKFYSFYRYFLLTLFHEGLGGAHRQTALEALLGRIPYLNGGLFDVHELERPDRYGNNIQIPDKAFARLFDYFDQYQWHLDERPLREDNEINPDVLGYIFERYINQRQMGAYYTKEDITDYITRNTLLPSILDATLGTCPLAFENAEGPTIWNLLSQDPDRYFYAAVRHGVHESIPEKVAANKPAPAPYGLPTETWREVIARRKHYHEVRGRLIAGAVRNVNDLVTLNLDIHQFAQDVIESCEDPQLLRALWLAVQGVTILDPTCGSGAFLFAALNILEPLYEACLDRMQAFVDDVERAGEYDRSAQFADFRGVLASVGLHPNRRYFILKRIVLNNLYGVDIMEEAAEICKLRLFLKLSAQVEADIAKPNLGIEPLPDIDFNIRVGNTLVGYATSDEVQHALAATLDFDNAAERISAKAADLQEAFDAFRSRQVENHAAAYTDGKQRLRGQLAALSEELDRHLASEYGVDPAKSAYTNWRSSHQPFHWFLEFHGIMARGGFDVIIGNPPYVSSAKVRGSYSVKRLAAQNCPDVYAWVMERSEALLGASGRTGMILPLSLGFSTDFDPIRRILFAAYGHNWFSSFGRIPAALFSFDVRVRNTIHLGARSRAVACAFTTRLHRWFEAARPALFSSLTYVPFEPALWHNRVPKLNTTALATAFERLLARRRALEQVFRPRPSHHILHYKKTAYNWLTFCRDLPPSYAGNRLVPQTKFGELWLPDSETLQLTLLLANGKLMLVFWFAVADDFDVTRWNVGEFPADLALLSQDARTELRAMARDLEGAMGEALQFKLNAGRKVGTYNLARCRAVTDKSDSIIAAALGLTHVWEDIELYYCQTVRTDFDSDSEAS